jgi:hypothetical protein
MLIPVMRMIAKFRSVFISFVIVCVILGTAFTIIAYGRGYRIDLTNLAVNSTGLVVIQSEPNGAQIIIDGKLKTATPATLTLKPGSYTITVAKDGFQSWEKHIKVQGEVVNKIDALLLPTNPSLAALTASGIVSPALSPDGSKLAYIVPETITTASSSPTLATKPGIWILDLVDKPLGFNRDAREITVSDTIDFSLATLSWSPDNKQLLATLPKPVAYYVFDVDQLTLNPQQIFDIKTIQNDWKSIKDQHEKEQLSTLPKLFTDVATTSAQILAFSPDETKILYQASRSASVPIIKIPRLLGPNSTEEIRTLKTGYTYVYDIKEDRNYLVSTAKSTPQWLPTSRHLVLVSKNTVEIMDFDGINRHTAYVGPFWDSFAVPWASGGKIVILTNLNTQASAVNNLYIVNLK